MGFISEFKEFAMRGNVIDMAVGIVIGAAFGKIVNSFVADIIMPPIGIITGNTDFSEQAFVIEDAKVLEDGTEIAAVTLNYGAFINTIVDFVIVALAIFVVIKMMNRLKRKEEAKPSAPPMPPKEEVLLTEIRDLLAARS